jgi:hypothetical protein
MDLHKEKKKSKIQAMDIKFLVKKLESNIC